MPISEEIARIIMTNGNSMDIAAQAQREGVRDLRQSGLLKVKQGSPPDRSPRLHQRVIASRGNNRWPLHQAPPAAPTSRANTCSSGKARTRPARSSAAKCAHDETVVQTDAAPPGHPAHKIRKQTFRPRPQNRRQDIALFTASSPRCCAPAFRCCRPSTSPSRLWQPSLARLLNDVRANVEKAAALSQVSLPAPPGPLRRPVLQTVAAGEQAGILETCSTACHLQGKRSSPSRARSSRRCSTRSPRWSSRSLGGLR